LTRKAVAKDFDDPDARALPAFPDVAHWSDEARALYGDVRDVHPDVAARFEQLGIARVLDIGCGTGAFKRCFAGSWIGLDRSIQQLVHTDGPRTLADATLLPFGDATFDGAVALYVLNFFDEPRAVLREAARVLRSGGAFATCAPSRADCPELRHVIPEEVFDDPFAAEDMEPVLGEIFEDVELVTWDFPAFDFVDRGSVRDYLRAYAYPWLTLEEAARRAESVDVPLKLTKRGAWGIGSKP